MPTHCELVHIGHVGRHGSRHGTRLREAVHIKDALLQAAAGESGEQRPRVALQRSHGPSLRTVLGDEAMRWVEEHIRKVGRGLAREALTARVTCLVECRSNLCSETSPSVA